MVVANIESRMRLHEPHGGPDGLANRAGFGAQIVFKSAHNPDARGIRKDYQPESLGCHASRERNGHDKKLVHNMLT